MLDFFVAVVLILSVIWGYLRGFLYDLLGLVALIVAFVGSAPFGENLGGALARNSAMSAGTAYVVVRVVAGVLIYVSLKISAVVANRKFGKTERGVTRRWNRNLGALGGLLSGLVTVLIVLFLADAVVKAFPESTNALVRVAEGSRFRRMVSSFNPADRFLLTDALRLIQAARDDPEVRRRLREDPHIQRILQNETLQRALRDEDLQRAIESDDYGQVLRNENLRAVLSDRELVEELLSEETQRAMRSAIEGAPEEEEQPES